MHPPPSKISPGSRSSTNRRKVTPSIHFSILESYPRNPNGDRYLLISYEPASGHMTSQTVQRSMEARSYSYFQAFNRQVLRASVDLELLLYDPENYTVEPVCL